VALALIALYGAGAQAHALEQSYLFLVLGDDAVKGYFELPLTDLNRGLGLDFPLDESATADDVGARLDRLQAYVRDKVQFALEGQPAEIRFEGHDLLDVGFARFAVLHFSLPPTGQPPRFIDVEFGVLLDEVEDHRTMLVIAEDWRTGTFDNESQVALTFDPDHRRQRLDLSSATPLNGFLGMVRQGTHHIWVGIDHVLFLVALLLPAVLRREPGGYEPVASARTALWNVTKLVTVFTLAHSLTLGAAALGWFVLPPRLVESVIALSIALAALDLVYPLFGRRILWVVFVFGLFHGFGFASVLGSMSVPASYLPLTLLGFNVGVELGQLAIVAAAFPLLFLLRASVFYRRYVLVVSAAGLVAVSLYWFTERAFEIDLPAGAILNAALELVA